MNSYCFSLLLLRVFDASDSCCTFFWAVGSFLVTSCVKKKGNRGLGLVVVVVIAVCIVCIVGVGLFCDRKRRWVGSEELSWLGKLLLLEIRRS